MIHHHPSITFFLRILDQRVPNWSALTLCLFWIWVCHKSPPKTGGFPTNNGHYCMVGRYHHGYGQTHLRESPFNPTDPQQSKQFVRFVTQEREVAVSLVDTKHRHHIAIVKYSYLSIALWLTKIHPLMVYRLDPFRIWKFDVICGFRVRLPKGIHSYQIYHPTSGVAPASTLDGKKGKRLAKCWATPTSQRNRQHRKQQVVPFGNNNQVN